MNDANMKWASALGHTAETAEPSLEKLFADCCEDLSKQLLQPADLAIVFVASQFADHFHEIPAYAREYLQSRTLIGCSAGGLIGGGEEIEQQPGIAITAAVLPGVEVTPFHVQDEDLPDLDAGQSTWEEIVGVENTQNPSFILLPDPFSFRVDIFAQGLDFAFPASPKVGGLASGANRVGMNALFLDNRVYRQGAVGVALSGNLQVDTIVAQGCRPVGWPLTVTKCDRNFLFELDGKTAVQSLYEVLESLQEKEQKLAQHSLLLGVVMNEFQEEFQPGDFLIRNILGLEPNTGALLVGESLLPGRTIQFHVRDADTSSEDLRSLLKKYKDDNQGSVSGALLFSCLGRGRHLYGFPNHDSTCFQEYLGNSVPLTGFFCSGEIGPVGGTTFLHGYTSSFGLIRPK